MYVLVVNDLTSLGRMGDEAIVAARFYFKTLKNAKHKAESHFGEKIKWHRDGEYLTSGDLNHVMYDIYKVQTED